VIFVALPFAVLQTGGGAAELGLVLASFTLARASFIVVGGVWADRLPRRLVMLAAAPDAGDRDRERGFRIRDRLREHDLGKRSSSARSPPSGSPG
jgi:hypothetical protein